MLQSYRVCVILLLASCGSVSPGAPPEQQLVEHPETIPTTPTTAHDDEASPTRDAPAIASPLLDSWGCVGPIQHIAQSYTVTLELRATGRFELNYSDVSPEGGRIIRVQGTWAPQASDEGGAVVAKAYVGSETTWRGDMHREQHRDPNGPIFATQRERHGVSTAERRWSATGEGPDARIQLDAEFGTHLGRVVTSGDEHTWPRCDPGRFNH